MKVKDSEFLRAVRFERPRYIPMVFAVNAACWQTYDQAQLVDLMQAHPFLFPDFQPPALPYTPDFANVARKDIPYTDDFGCVWTTTADGITGTVTGHPLEDWAKLDGYAPPDPAVCMGIGPVSWQKERGHIQSLHEQGKLAAGSLRHGHTFLQLSDLRGYMNLTYDMADGEPRLWKLIEMVEAFNQYIVDQYLAMDVDMMCYPEDLGMQLGPMLSPAHFRKYIKPSYTRLMRAAREKGTIVHLHSDGDIRELIYDLIDGGVEVFNLQDLVNGIDWIAANLKGKLCIELDLDRQRITACGTPAQIDAHVREAVEKLSMPEGGFAMIYGLYPGLPMENVRAVMDAMERYAFFYD